MRGKITVKFLKLQEGIQNNTGQYGGHIEAKIEISKNYVDVFSYAEIGNTASPELSN